MQGYSSVPNPGGYYQPPMGAGGYPTSPGGYGVNPYQAQGYANQPMPQVAAPPVNFGEFSLYMSQTQCKN